MSTFLAKYARGREHNPCDECADAGKQQDVIQESGHCTPPCGSLTRRDGSALPYLGRKVAAGCPNSRLAATSTASKCRGQHRFWD